MTDKTVEELEEEIKALKNQLESEKLAMTARNIAGRTAGEETALRRAINWVRKTWDGF